MDAYNKAIKFIDMVEANYEPECLEFIEKNTDFHDIQVPLYGSCGYKTTSLIRASYLNRKNIVQKLISYGTDINGKNSNGETALVMACDFNNVDIINILLDNKADVMIKSDTSKTSALMGAFTNNNVNVAKRLIDHGADIMELINVASIDRTKPDITTHIRERYKQEIVITMNDQSVDNMMANCFRTTYVSGLVDIIGEFII
ncbi:MAG: hypothetical protein Faunusvirus11_26 [Faunusvirus sp.]|jgi:ankyrin repeat protein|uniref:Uncharacterized protein n=1 Tax=Faunusvirus sp. TaxID=2487766 RepID=A0A3G4ZWV8_9VIRU|nr:MAG: hypothetical protein Faunusvirus11_26 [Faunusvirus sp.]